MKKITINDFSYLQQLKQIKNPPNQLYYKGNIELLNSPGIAIIGSRGCTKYGEKMAKKFAKELSMYGLVIISGMANGIDSYAHLGALDGSKKTIAVLPSGLNNIYPKENTKLYEEILNNNGLIISEYSENEEAKYEKFLQRNRIVSGLSIGTLVVEGGHRSGTSITARLTREQGKNVFCVPSNLDSKMSITPNRLIKDGAYLVTCVEDIVKQYPELNLNRIKVKEKTKKVDKEYEQVYEIIEKNESIHINKIVKITGLTVSEVSYKLMMLELEDKIISLPGSVYEIK